MEQAVLADIALVLILLLVVAAVVVAVWLMQIIFL
jgi:hypothetical protein